MSHPFHKRLLKENKSLSTTSLPGISLVETNPSLTEYTFDIQCKDHPIYKNNIFKLLVVIPKEYPVQPPKVKFLTIPKHPHIYSNGHICLNLLGDDWSPASSIESVVVSLQSMLNNNEVDEGPPDDERYVRGAGDFAGRGVFVYHDDSV